MRAGPFYPMLLLFAALGCLGVSAASAATYVHLYGGPGSLDGRFETAQGEVDGQGWAGLQCPEVGTEFLWQVSDFKAETLNAHGPGNHAMWAGQTAEQRPWWLNPPGYGNYWNTAVQWSHPAPTVVAPFQVALDAVFNYEIEPFYDIIYVEWNQAGTWQSLQQIDGSSGGGSGSFAAPGVALSQSWTVQPADLVDGEVQIRIRVTSDGIVSDETGGSGYGFPFDDTDGAMQIDDIMVSFDGVPVDGGGDANGLATFEGGDDEGWTPQPDTCSCSVVSELAGDIDPGPDNLTPQIGLFRSANYPGTQVDGCSFQSPEIAWDVPAAQGLNSTLLRFRGYLESSVGVQGWRLFVVSKADGQWLPTETIVRQTNPPPPSGWGTYDWDISEYIPANAEAIRLWFVAIGTGDEVRITFDDIQVMRFDSSITPAPPSTPSARVELAVYPNPTNPTSVISYTTDVAGPVRLELFDARGRKVRTILEDSKPAGSYTARFYGVDDRGRAVVSGVYFVRMQLDGRQYSQRVVLVR